MTRTRIVARKNADFAGDVLRREATKLFDNGDHTGAASLLSIADALELAASIKIAASIKEA